MNKTINFSKLFPDERLTGETDLRNAQLVMLRMLKVFDHLCRENNVEYWIDFGTLLGAVRHKGFIPWDGDLDVGMTRKSYRRFIKTCVSHLPRDIFFQTAETDPYYPAGNLLEAKLRDRYSNYVEWQEKNPDVKWHNGIQLDIFVYDRWLSKNKSIFQTQKKIMVKSVMFQRFLKLFYKIKKVEHYAVSEGMIFYEGDVFPLKTLEFEGVAVTVPRNHDTYLRNYYGDYMTPPPEGERYPHEGKIDLVKPCNHKEILWWDKGE